MSRENTAPGPVRAAGALVAVQGLATLVFVVIELVRGIAGLAPAGLAISLAAIYLVVAAACAVPGVLLWQGRRGARNAAVFLQLLLIGGVWLGFNPIDSVPTDILFTVYCLAVLVLLLFVRSSVTWAMGVSEDESEVR